MVFLDRIIRQVDVLIRKIFHVKLLAGSSNITVLIPITLLIAIHGCYQNVGSYIKFSFLI
jgi:hypothetical protein